MTVERPLDPQFYKTLHKAVQELFFFLTQAKKQTNQKSTLSKVHQVLGSKLFVITKFNPYYLDLSQKASNISYYFLRLKKKSI